MDFDIDAAVSAAIARKSELDKKEEARYQAEQRAKFNVPTDVEVTSELGRRMVQTAWEHLNKGVSVAEFERLAEGYALQGDFEEALRYAQDPERIAYYKRILQALDITADCSCPKTQSGVPTRFIKSQFPRNGTIVRLIACAICGHLRC